MPPSSNMKAAWVFFPGIFLRLFNQKIDMTLGGCVSELQKITKLRSNNTHNPNIPFSLFLSLSHTHTHTHTLQPSPSDCCGPATLGEGCRAVERCIIEQ